VDGEERTAERNHVGPLCWVVRVQQYDCTWNAEWNGCMTSNGWWGQTDTCCQLDTTHGQTATGFEKRSSPGKCGGVVVEILNSIIFESPRKAAS
jgi:hypothetical protein